MQGRLCVYEVNGAEGIESLREMRVYTLLYMERRNSQALGHPKGSRR